MSRNGGKNNGFKFETFSALTVSQKNYIKAINDNHHVIAIGEAGTGKSYVASCLASEYYWYGKVERITIIRPNVPASRDIGFLPGECSVKMQPWAYPILEVLEEKLQAKYYDGINNGTIYAFPIMYLRGVSLRNSFIIIDEAQNLTIAELQLILTRIGENSKVIITGDLSQTDIKGLNGLSFLVSEIYRRQLPIPIIEFLPEDIVRSPACQMWVEIFKNVIL